MPETSLFPEKGQIYIAPSLLSADFAFLADEVKAVETAGAQWLHYDVMDNHYVPNLTVGPLVLKSLRPHTQLPVDVHLMVEPVDSLIEPFAKAGADIITFHCEASRHIDRTLAAIRDAGCKAGLVFNPATPLTYLDYEMDKIDLILLMSVNPGVGGQKFIPGTVEKIREVKARCDRYFEATRRRIPIEVDGGVNAATIRACAEAGAEIFVAGSAVFGKKTATGYGDAVNALLAAARG